MREAVVLAQVSTWFSLYTCCWMTKPLDGDMTRAADLVLILPILVMFLALLCAGRHLRITWQGTFRRVFE